MLMDLPQILVVRHLKFLDFQKLEARKMEFECIEGDMNGLIKEVRSAMASLAGASIRFFQST
jgi:hypothetical protein